MARGDLAPVRAPRATVTARALRRELRRASPNLVVIDGGKGQLSAALAAMQALRPAARRRDRARQAGGGGLRAGPPGADRARRATPPGLQLLQRIRDEAHRFALGFHRQRRDAQARESIFDALPGVGPARRRALHPALRLGRAPARASQEELEGVPGLPAKVGREIYAALHRTGGA